MLEEAPKVFPSLPTTLYVHLNQKDMCNIVKNHIRAIERMSKDSAVHTMFGIDVKAMTEEERLVKFIHVHDEGTKVHRDRNEERTAIETYEAIFTSSGCKIAWDDWVNVKCALAAEP